MTYHRRYRSFKEAKETKRLPKLKKFDKLSLNDLLKLKAIYEASLPNQKEMDKEKQKINSYQTEHNKKLSLYNQHYKNIKEYKRHFSITQKSVESIEYQLKQFVGGSIHQWIYNNCKRYSYHRPFGQHIGTQYENFQSSSGYFDLKNASLSESLKLAAEHNKAIEGLNEIYEKLKMLEKTDNPYPKPTFDYKYKPTSFWSKSCTVLTLNGVRVEIDFVDINLSELNDLIDFHRSKIEAIHEIKARAASNELETRKLAQPFRRKLNKQLSILDCCPYCGDQLLLNDSHLDHIYPVSKGGLSSPKNLVFVCSSCNQQKSDSTLRHFIEEKGVHSEEVHERLKTLLKDF